MAQAKLKTAATTQSVEPFLQSVSDPSQREDAKKIDQLFQEISGEPPVMWGTSIIGYGQEHLCYDSGRELEWLKLGFSPRKGSISLHILRGGIELYDDLLKQLGKHTTGKGCLYIKKLSDINLDVLQKIVKKALSVER